MNRRRMASASWRVAASALFAFAVVAGASLVSALADAPPSVHTEGQILGVTKESAGAVTVTLTPRRYAGGELFVDLGVKTHTVNDLERYDLKKIVSLDFDGKSIRPTSAPRLRGHHNSGQLVFPLTVLPGSFAIKIRGLDQPALRVLSWP